MSYKSKKIKWKVPYTLSGELSGKSLSYFLFSSKNLKSIFSLEVSRLINLTFVFKTVNIEK